MTIRTPECHCLDCGKKFTASSDPNDENIPGEGDFTVCLYCGHLMVYNTDLTVRALTDAEMYEAAGDPDVLKAVKFSEEFRKYKTMVENEIKGRVKNEKNTPSEG